MQKNSSTEEIVSHTFSVLIQKVIKIETPIGLEILIFYCKVLFEALQIYIWIASLFKKINRIKLQKTMRSVGQ